MEVTGAGDRTGSGAGAREQDPYPAVREELED